MSSKAGILTCTSAVPARCSGAVLRSLCFTAESSWKVRWPLQCSDDLCKEKNKDIKVIQAASIHFVPPEIRGTDASPARWWVWISSRPVRVLRDLRSLKATTGTMSSSLVSTSCDVFVPTGSLAASSMVPLCTGCVFSFGWASFGKAFADSDRCVKKELISLVEDLLFDFRSRADTCQWILDMRHESP